MKLKDFTKEQQARMKRGGIVYDKGDGFNYCFHKGRIFRTEQDTREMTIIQPLWEDATND